MKQLNIGIDLDGVLVDFVGGFVPYMIKATGRDLFSNGKSGEGAEFPNNWDFPLTCGYTKEEYSDIWDRIAADPTFWFSLAPLGGELHVRTILDKIRKLRWDGHAIYFVTTRMGIDCKLQTEGWLRNYSDRSDIHTVLLTGDKAGAARILDLDCYIDDRLRNANDVQREWPKCRMYLKDAPYNRRETVVLAEGQDGVTGENRRDPRLIVVNGVMDMFREEGI